mmetsp:Transcript_44423/g.105939  ORF Transcript_44423/g.105939 Transcript_44423/m.105939 type:complete len:218 (-) Transcript_44423:61-714(-)
MRDDPESVLLADVHDQQNPHDEVHALTVADCRIVKRVGVEDAVERGDALRPVRALLVKERVAREGAVEIKLKLLVAVLALAALQQRREHVLALRRACLGRAAEEGPHERPKLRRNTVHRRPAQQPAGGAGAFSLVGGLFHARELVQVRVLGLDLVRQDFPLLPHPLSPLRHHEGMLAKLCNQLSVNCESILVASPALRRHRGARQAQAGVRGDAARP